MTNLNGTMSFSGAAGLIGKAVAFNSLDSNGNQYQGVVVGVSKSGDQINLDVKVTENGTDTIEQFSYSDVSDVIGS